MIKEFKFYGSIAGGRMGELFVALEKLLKSYEAATEEEEVEIHILVADDIDPPG